MDGRSLVRTGFTIQRLENSLNPAVIIVQLQGMTETLASIEAAAWIRRKSTKIIIKIQKIIFKLVQFYTHVREYKTLPQKVGI